MRVRGEDVATEGGGSGDAGKRAEAGLLSKRCCEMRGWCGHL